MRNTNPIAIQKEINAQVGTVKSPTIIIECFNHKQVSKMLELVQFTTYVKTKPYTPISGF